ncbi:MAG: hypothetical protein CSA70_07020 [Rhodobacterales bacterium]|nr:MAG: hypothetical protein CSA70_07020 [Rhodobacterales bacterium]
MKPNFALSLSFEGIALLHRAFPGWNKVGDVGLDSPDLGAALSDLRTRAEALNGGELLTKLVIPNDQIKYLSLGTGVMDDTQRDALIRDALDGATPYTVDELAYDWSTDGDMTHVAAVAWDTLSEAENFAVEHGFQPLSFVATPDGDDFSGEPFFGTTAFAAARLAEGEEVLRDTAPIRVIGVATPVKPADPVATAAPVVTPTEAPPPETPPAPTPDPEPVAPPLAEDSAETAEPTPPLPTFEHFAQSQVADADSEPAPLTAPAVEPPSRDEAQRPKVEERPEVENTSVAPAFSTIRAQRNVRADMVPDAVAAPTLSGVRRGADDLTAPSIPIPTGDEDSGDAATPEIQGVPESDHAPAASFDDIEDDVPPMPAYLAARNETEFASPAAPAPVERPQASEPESQGESRMAFISRRGADLASGVAAGIGNSIAATRARRSEAKVARDAANTDQPATQRPATQGNAQSERQRMTVFGAREPEKNKVDVGGKPRFLGLILTACLLIFLAGVAAWASIFLDEGLARFFAPRTTEIATLPPDAADELMAEGEEAMVPTRPEDSFETAALGTGVSDGASPSALAQPAQPDPVSLQEAQSRYAVTGIWVLAPDSPELPSPSHLNNLYVASIDPQVDSQDAVALPALAELQTDRNLGEIAPTIARGTQFALDDRGLVIATAEGARSPEGFMVFAGRPPRAPGTLPERTEKVELSAAEKRLAGLRPKLRPVNLVEQTERETFGGRSRAELAGLRPKARPPKAIPDPVEESAPQVVEVKPEPGAKPEETQNPDAPEATAAAGTIRFKPGTAQAVVESRRPNARSRNFSRVVERARKKAENSEARVTQVAAVKPRTVTPKIPSKASVAKQATVRNALNLRKINLIGVYGKPSSRRALVRLANGRYKKVKIGDRIDGGRISAIGDSELRYNKNGRNVILKMPRG